MSDAEKIISEIGELEEKVENREDEIRDMKNRIDDLNEILGVSNFDDDGMIMEIGQYGYFTWYFWCSHIRGYNFDLVLDRNVLIGDLL